MPRLLLKYTLTFIITLAFMSLAARTLGNIQPPNPALQGFHQGCQNQLRRCWYGIVPEKTTFDDAVQMLKDTNIAVEISPSNRPYVDAVVKLDDIGCEVWLFRSGMDTNLIGLLSFQNCQTLKLGDILNLLGTPYTIGTTLSCDFKPWEHVVPMASYWMLCPNIGSATLNAKPDFWTWLSLENPVVTFDVNNLRGDYPLPKKWVGFIPFWRYLRLHPDQVQTSSCGP